MLPNYKKKKKLQMSSEVDWSQILFKISHLIFFFLQL